MEPERNSTAGRIRFLGNAIQLYQCRRNLPSCAAIMGNTGVWKPSRNSYVSNYRIMKLMMDAGLPAGVINFIPGQLHRLSVTFVCPIQTLQAFTLLAQQLSSGSCGEMLPTIWRIFEVIQESLVKPAVKTSLSLIQIATKRPSL